MEKKRDIGIFEFIISNLLLFIIDDPNQGTIELVENFELLKSKHYTVGLP